MYVHTQILTDTCVCMCLFYHRICNVIIIIAIINNIDRHLSTYYMPETMCFTHINLFFTTALLDKYILSLFHGEGNRTYSIGTIK